MSRTLTTNAAALLVASMAGCTIPAKPPASADARALFLDDVKPILERNCLRCHNGSSPLIALDLRNRQRAMASRHPDGRPFVVAGDPDKSLLLTAVSRSGLHPKMMPRQPLSLTDMELGSLREWISAGAWWPAGPEGELRAAPNPEGP
jgi:hypothetical protein